MSQPSRFWSEISKQVDGISAIYLLSLYTTSSGLFLAVALEEEGRLSADPSSLLAFTAERDFLAYHHMSLIVDCLFNNVDYVEYVIS